MNILRYFFEADGYLEIKNAVQRDCVNEDSTYEKMTAVCALSHSG
jgi:hypothetical protein